MSGVVDNSLQQDADDGILPSLSRRTALTLLGAGALSQAASADSNAGSKDVEPNGESMSDLTESEHVRAFIDEVLPGDKFGKLEIGEFQHTLQLAGTRSPSWMVQPFSEDKRITSTSYDEIGSGIGYGVIPFPPGQVPVLRLVGHINGTPEAETSLRVSIANREAYSPPGVDGVRVLEDDEVRQTLIEVTAKGDT